MEEESEAFDYNKCFSRLERQQERLYMTGQQLTTHLTTQLTAVKKRNFSL